MPLARYLLSKIADDNSIHPLSHCAFQIMQVVLESLGQLLVRIGVRQCFVVAMHFSRDGVVATSYNGALHENLPK